MLYKYDWQLLAMGIATILICCPTHDGQSYCLERFLKGVAGISYPSCDVLFADNSGEESYSKRLREKAATALSSMNVLVVRDSICDSRIARIISSRNLVRGHFLRNRQYTSLFFLDTDIIPPKEVIVQLLSADADIASGIYLSNQKIGDAFKVLPAIYKKHNDDSAATVTLKEVEINSIMDILICGLGCCLIKRNVLEQIPFRPYSDSKTGGEDVAFCLDAHKKGFAIRAHCGVKCAHMGKKAMLVVGPSSA